MFILEEFFQVVSKKCTYLLSVFKGDMSFYLLLYPFHFILLHYVWLKLSTNTWLSCLVKS